MRNIALNHDSPHPLRLPKHRRISKGVYNRLLVNAHLHHHGPMSRVELAEATALPWSVLTDLCSDLVEKEFLAELDRPPRPANRRGRPRRLLNIASAKLGAIGIRYGRNELEAAVVDLLGGIRWRRKYEGPFGGLPEGLLSVIRTAISDAIAASPIPRSHLLGIGCADPGIVNRRTGRVFRAVNVPGWENVPVVEHVRNFTNLPTFVDRHDGFEALGEVFYGAGQGAHSALYVMICEGGVGGGFVEERQLVAGRDGAAGELGHINLVPDGVPCACGLKGCLEAYAHPSRLLERLHATDPSSRDRMGDFSAMIRAARDGHETSRALLAEMTERLARVVGSAVNLLNPQCVLLGGYLAEAEDLIVEPLRKALGRYTIREFLDALSLRTCTRGKDAAFCGIVGQIRECAFAYPLKGSHLHAPFA